MRQPTETMKQRATLVTTARAHDSLLRLLHGNFTRSIPARFTDDDLIVQDYLFQQEMIEAGHLEELVKLVFPSACLRGAGHGKISVAFSSNDGWYYLGHWQYTGTAEARRHAAWMSVINKLMAKDGKSV